jgi:23S rRNA (uracil1939-C5)-methyltransferase
MDVTVNLKRFEFSGQARGRHQGRLVFAWGGLPDERVTAMVIRKRRRSYSCIVSDVETPSPHRVAPREDHYIICSPWQVLAEDQEAAVKAQLVLHLFAEQYNIVLPDFEVTTGEFYGYRNKLEFSFTDTDEGVSTAFFQRESFRRKTALEGCLLGMDALNVAARDVRNVLRSASVNSDSLKSLVVRCNQAGQVAAALYVTETIPALCPAISDQGNIASMRVFRSDPRSPASVAGEELEGYGSAVLKEHVLGRALRYSDRSFFQINIPLLEIAARDICSYVTAGEPVFDLYAGVGTLGICAGVPGTVFVESHDETVAFLEENCRANGLADPRILAAPAEKAIESIPAEATVIVDPPRAGLHPRMVQRLADALPRKILYLSCNPETQARDVAAWIGEYDLADFRGYNFFPRTPRVETLAVLERKEPRTVAR